MSDVISSAQGYVAVGGGYDAGTETPLAAIWVSADASDWQRVALEGEAGLGQISSITSGGPGFVAVGGQCCPDRAAVWTSADGLAWSRVADQPAFEGAAMAAATSWSGGLVAVGCTAELECTGPAIWTSVDGLTWEAVSLAPDLGPAALADVTATGSVLIAVGSTDAFGHAPPAILVSLDGTAWTPASVPAGTASLVGVASASEGAIATGTSFDEATGRGRAIMLLSSDGAEWQARDSDSFAGAAGLDVLRADHGFVAVGLIQRRQASVAASWLSQDGRRWGRLLPGSRGAMHAVSSGAGVQLVAVGQISAGDETSPAVWVGTGF